MIILGGENVYPCKLEDFVYEHPEVQDVQVRGVIDEKYGEEIMLPLKIPRYWKFVDTFQMTVTGKVQKFRLPEIAIVELQLQRAAAIRAA